MAKHLGHVSAVMLIAARLARVHVAFTLRVNDEGDAVIETRNQATLDAAIEQQRNQEEDNRS